jgi:hypothetical protein
MKTQAITIDRRQHAREGILAEIENLTYSVLRRYEINSTTEQRSPGNMTETAA